LPEGYQLFRDNLLISLSGFLVGLLVGQTGTGGGSLMTPLLVLLFGIHPATAVGTDLLYASATKSVGTLVHGMNHTVDWRIVGRLAGGSVPATAATLLLLSRFDLNTGGAGAAISAILGVMLLLTALALVFRRPFVGVLLGILVTISSVGAGALGVTALLLLYPRLPMATIVGSDIAHAVPLTLLAGIGHWLMGSTNWLLLAWLLAGSIPGIVIGSYLAVRVPDAVLRPILAATLAVVAGKLLF
jgi:uncharacterized membrane protein YfcA